MEDGMWNGFRNVEWIPECGMDSGMWNEEYGMWNWNVECGMWNENPESRIENRRVTLEGYFLR